MENVFAYDVLVKKLSDFFTLNKGYLNVPVQSRLSILSACEDPFTVSPFSFAGEQWPLPQTGQMQLESELLKNPNYNGVFCISTSYRNEPNPITGRHDLIFPMFEFEGKGDFGDLLQLEQELCTYLFKDLLGLSPLGIAAYDFYTKKYGVDELEIEHETLIEKDYGASIIINFPESTHPFWNMKHNGETYNKADVILGGMETIGSAERETDAVKMEERFATLSDGKYAQKLYDLFGKERVDKELDEYLGHNFFPRFGGGIGMTRLDKAFQFYQMKKKV